MKILQKLFVYFFVIIVIMGIILGLNRNDEKTIQSSLIQVPLASGDFAYVSSPKQFNFPEDFGPHPEYQTEWWYYTGNLEDENGRHFGYQLTFFRRALISENDKVIRESDWAADQVYLAHFALTDVREGSFHYSERIQRGSAGLAGAKIDFTGFSVWMEDWEVIQIGNANYSLYAKQNEVELNLNLENLKGIALQGQQGFSPKGDLPGNASYYFSQTRLESSGEIIINGELFRVSGLSWMDHEYSTSALGADLVGWDWFSLQLSDGSELMLFTIRDAAGNISPYSSGNYILPNGENRFLKRNDFQIEVLDIWKSKNSGAEYPSGWRVVVPEFGITLEIEPYQKDQELQVFFTYWEGAVKISGDISGIGVTGSGYVELTGYAQSMQGQL